MSVNRPCIGKSNEYINIIKANQFFFYQTSTRFIKNT